MKEVAIKQESAIQAISSFSPETLLSKAIDSNVPVETIERLLAMRKELKAEQAKEQFFIALSEFQGACPPITKSKAVKAKNGDIRYKYATLDDIVKTVTPTLKANGLSYTVKTEPTETGIKAICEIHHGMGHTECSSFEVPIDKEAFMSDAQKAGSAQMYAKRYAFCNALGILTTDDDDDGNFGDKLSVQDMYKRTSDIVQIVLQLSDSIKAIKQGIADNTLEIAAEAWNELTEDEKRCIWIAPTKGGPFTTSEVAAIKSDEFAKIARELSTVEEE